MSTVNTVSPATTPPSRFNIGDRILGSLQSVGRSLMLPIAVLPAAALLLRLGQDDILQLVGLHQAQLPWLSAAGNTVFTNLPMIFAVGIAIGLTSDAGSAALAALIGYLVFNSVFDTIIPQVNGQPDPNITMGVMGGLLVGLVTAGLYRRFHDIRLPDFLAFFGGRRFVPIITALVMLILGLIFGWIWPWLNSGVNAAGNWVVSLGALGTGIYGFLNRLLIPLGLHHILNFIVWQQIGSYTLPNGTVVHGDLNRYFAGDPTAGNFMAGFFPIMMFGLPAACLAMVRHARYPRVAAGILLSAAFASLVTGVTEPVEYAFIFIAPQLFLVHAILTGTSLAVCTLLNIRIGFGFSAGLIDYLLNFSKSNTSNAGLLLLVGVAYGIIYYFVFSFFIKTFNLATPGRGDAKAGISADWILPESQRGPKPSASRSANANGATMVATEDADDVLAAQVLEALGGKQNVESIEGCITRLRLFIRNPEVIDDARLKAVGAAGVVKRGKVVQVVLGTQSDRIAERIKRLMKAEVGEEK